jgi:ElaB/YqjD/DUF883 family membrane-anchored ribosome-binding protein
VEVLNDLKAVLKESAAKEKGKTTPVKESEANKDFQEQRRHKRNSSDDQAKKHKKAVMPTAGVWDPRTRSQL